MYHGRGILPGYTSAVTVFYQHTFFYGTTIEHIHTLFADLKHLKVMSYTICDVKVHIQYGSTALLCWMSAKRTTSTWRWPH